VGLHEAGNAAGRHNYARACKRQDGSRGCLDGAWALHVLDNAACVHRAVAHGAYALDVLVLADARYTPFDAWDSYLVSYPYQDEPVINDAALRRNDLPGVSRNSALTRLESFWSSLTRLEPFLAV
jgi:hypothetical protein